MAAARDPALPGLVGGAGPEGRAADLDLGVREARERRVGALLEARDGGGARADEGHAALQDAVLGASEEMPEGSATVRGFDFNTKPELDALLAACMHTGFQATNLAKAIEEINNMLAW